MDMADAEALVRGASQVNDIKKVDPHLFLSTIHTLMKYDYREDYCGTPIEGVLDLYVAVSND